MRNQKIDKIAKNDIFMLARFARGVLYGGVQKICPR